MTTSTDTVSDLDTIITALNNAKTSIETSKTFFDNVANGGVSDTYTNSNGHVVKSLANALNTADMDTRVNTAFTNSSYNKLWNAEKTHGFCRGGLLDADTKIISPLHCVDDTGTSMITSSAVDLTSILTGFSANAQYNIYAVLSTSGTVSYQMTTNNNSPSLSAGEKKRRVFTFKTTNASAFPSYELYPIGNGYIYRKRNEMSGTPMLSVSGVGNTSTAYNIIDEFPSGIDLVLRLTVISTTSDSDYKLGVTTIGVYDGGNIVHLGEMDYGAFSDTTRTSKTFDFHIKTSNTLKLIRSTTTYSYLTKVYFIGFQDFRAI